MIQGQINSMIAQIGNMAHVRKTLQNTEKAEDNKKGIENVAEKAVNNEKKVMGVEDSFLEDKYRIYGTIGQIDPNVAKKLIQRTDAFDFKAAGYTQPDWDKRQAKLAGYLTAEQLANMDMQRQQMRKPSTVKTPGGKNDGK